jgi:hypothetical protein
MPSKLSQAARDDIQLQLETGTRVDVIASAFQITPRQVWKMKENIRFFGVVAPDPAQFHLQGRPPAVTPKAREAVLDFLLDNGKLAYIDEGDIEVSWVTVQRLVKSLQMTKKVVSFKSIRASLTNIPQVEREMQQRDEDHRLRWQTKLA